MPKSYYIHEVFSKYTKKIIYVMEEYTNCERKNGILPQSAKNPSSIFKLIFKNKIRCAADLFTCSSNQICNLFLFVIFPELFIKSRWGCKNVVCNQAFQCFHPTHRFLIAATIHLQLYNSYFRRMSNQKCHDTFFQAGIDQTFLNLNV